MADIDEDDGFLDDDLDALISQDFLELQQRALRSTQQQKPTFPAVPRLQEISHTMPVGSGRRSPRGSIDGKSRPLAQAYTDNPSSDYGDLDDEVLDAGLLDVSRDPLHTAIANAAGHRPQGESTQREQWRQQRYAGPSNLLRPDQVQSASTGKHSQSITGDDHNARTETDLEDEEELLEAPDQIVEPVLGAATDHVDDLQAKIVEVTESRFFKKYFCLQAYLVASGARNSSNCRSICQRASFCKGR